MFVSLVESIGTSIITLDLVLTRLQDHGLTLKLAKCEFGKEEVEFYGVRFTGGVRTLEECGEPTSRSKKFSPDGRIYVSIYPKLCPYCCPTAKPAINFSVGTSRTRSF